MITYEVKQQKIYKPTKDYSNNMPPGDLKRSPDESFFSIGKDNAPLVFIDDAFLSKLSKYLGEGKYIKFDRIILSEILAEKEKLNCEKVHIYISPPFQSSKSTKEEELRKRGYDKFINKLKEKGVIAR